MKQGIHPTWYPDTKVVCACGANFTTGSTLPEIRVEICSNCHPFFTGQQKFVDTLGQVERFQKKVQDSVVKKQKVKEVQAKRAAKVHVEKSDKPTLKDLLLQARKKTASQL